ncbi:MAG: nucleotide exchange factor GrpE [Oscillospiraceae bacterium]|nr:nucleotide exchange factor GrpE [Oscillospiraceae bacterium]
MAKKEKQQEEKEEKKMEMNEAETPEAEETEKEKKEAPDEKSEEQTKLEKLRKELDAAKEAHIRTLAEYDNFRKRTQKEKEAIFGDCKAKVLTEILSVLDNFERAAMNDSADFEAYKKGVEMTFQSFSALLSKLGVEPFGEVGDKFDPNLYNAVMHCEDESLEENVVADVFSKGYKLGDRVLRHAMVKVAN